MLQHISDPGGAIGYGGILLRSFWTLFPPVMQEGYELRGVRVDIDGMVE